MNLKTLDIFGRYGGDPCPSESHNSSCLRIAVLDKNVSSGLGCWDKKMIKVPWSRLEHLVLNLLGTERHKRIKG